jgi:hypothetical protein
MIRWRRYLGVIFVLMLLLLGSLMLPSGLLLP